MNADQIRQNMLATKYYKLNEADKAYQPNEESEESATYFQRLTAKIIDNLELKLLNIHIRYEDSFTIPDRIFSVGLTLDSFTVVTTDSNWVESFVARAPSKDPSSIHKLGVLSNAGMYWNINSRSYASFTLEDWEEQMYAMIYSTDRAQQPTSAYILSPPSKLILKFIHNEHYPEALPKFDVYIESNDIQLAVDKVQYQQLFSFLDMLWKVERMQLIAMEKRPQLRPKEDPRGWWRYAYKLVIGRGNTFRLKVDVMKRCIASRRRYIELMKIQNEQEIIENDTIVMAYESEMRELAVLEEELPLEALIVFRQLAKQEKAKELIEHRRRSSDEMHRTWWGWLNGEDSSGPVEKDDVSIDTLQTELMSDSDVSVKGYYMRLRVSSSASLQLSEALQPIVHATMTTYINTETRSDSFTAFLSIGNVCMEDRFTPNPVIKNIIAVQRDADNDDPKEEELRDENLPSFEVTYTLAGGNTKVKINALPLEFTINKQCVQQLLAFFYGSDGEPTTKKRNYFTQSSKRKKLRKQAGLSKDEGFEFIFEADAPKIIVPENSSSDKGYVMLDTGHLVVVGRMATKGMEWDIILKHVNAGMPSSAKDLYGFRSENKYLIRPFDVSVQLQTVEKSAADMTVDVLLKPSLSGELDALKLARLLRVIRNITYAFVRQEKAVPVSATKQTTYNYPVAATPYNAGDSTDDEDDLTRVLMLVRVKVPEVTLDLIYDAEDRDRNHLVLNVKTLDVKYFNRQLDTDILIDLSSLSIQDNSRVETQRYLAWTPAINRNLIHFSYTFMRSFRSPVYLNHASEVLINFANLALNIDAVTVLNLRPFILVLLYKDSYSRQAAREDAAMIEQMTPAQLLVHPPTPTSSATSVAVVAPPTAASSRAAPYGMRLVLTLEMISLDLLRKRTHHNPGVGLEAAFALQISNLTGDIELTDLVKTDIRIRSLDILDKRAISKDYFYKNLFSIAPPVDKASLEDDADSVRVLYTQSSRTNSSCDVLIPHLSSFLSLDAVLDLSDISVANAFAFLALNSLDAAGDDASSVPSSPSSPLPEEALTMTTMVRIPNPKLILLEDPTAENTKGIVLRCALDVNYSREAAVLEGGGRFDVKESLLVAIQRLEVFVLNSLVDTAITPQQILEPFNLEYNLRRRIERAIVLTCDMSLDMDTVDVRLSVRDIALAQSILTRRTLSVMSEDGAAQADCTTVSSAEATEDEKAGGGVIAEMAAYSFALNCSSANLVLINDYFGQNIPFLRIVTNGVSLSAGGLMRQLCGTGAVLINADFYNSELSLWEPVLDRWALTTDLNSTTEEIVFELCSAQTLQVSVTGYMLERVLQTQALLLYMDSAMAPSQSAPEICVRNMLGAGVDVVLIDSLYSAVVATLPGGSTDPVPLHFQGSSSSSRRDARVPVIVDMHFTGALEKERVPLLQLPLKSIQPRMYTLQLSSAYQEVTGRQYDPVLVEYFENQRYDPYKTSWRLPFLPMDPPTQSTVRGKPYKAPVFPDALDWEWLGDWIVDMRGEEGREIDCEGWEYGTSFNALCVNKPQHRRTRQPMDCVRRRKFIRTRIHRSSGGGDQSTRPLSLFWGVEQLENGTRLVTIRSGIEFRNNLPYEVMLSVSHATLSEGVDFGPIGSNQTFALPLLYTFITSATIRPANSPHKWSNPFMCTVLPFDCKTKYDLECSYSDEEVAISRYVLVHSSQTNRSLLLTLTTYLEIANWLPCAVCFKCFADNNYEESGTLESGSTNKLSIISVHNGAKLSIQAGHFGWSDPVLIEPSQSIDSKILLTDEHGARLALYVEYSTQSDSKNMRIVIYSKGAVVDRSGLEVSLWSKLKDGGDVLRCTYGPKPNNQQAHSSHYPGVIQGPSLDVLNFRIDSQRGHQLLPRTEVGSDVYVDRTQKWSHLPAVLRGQLMISTSCDDKTVRSKQYMQFNVNVDVVVFVLFDVRLTNLPAWVAADGFQRIPQVNGIARMFHYKADPEEIHFSTYGRVFTSAETVTLRGNWGKQQNMYVPFVVPLQANVNGLKEIMLTLHFEKYFSSELVTNSWVNGDNGISLFAPEADTVTVGLLRGAAFSEEIKVGEKHPAVGSFEVVDWKSRRAYQLTYRLESMPGEFKRTRLMYVMPRYCIVNCMDEVLEVRQYKSRLVNRIQPWSSEGWHKSDVAFDFSIQFKLGCSMWSRCNVDINDIGTSTLLLPPPDGLEDASPIVLHVEVRVAERSEQCAVLVVVQRARVDGSAVLSILNESDTTVIVVQSGVDLNYQELKGFEIIVKPGSWAPFGWIDPEGSSVVTVGVGQSFVGANTGRKHAKMDLMKLKASLRLPDGSGRSGCLGELVLQVESIEAGRVLRITRGKEPSRREDHEVFEKSTFQASVFKLTLSSLSISLIVEKPTRREFLSLYADDIEGRFVFSKGQTSYEFFLMDLQLDNFCETAIYPVLMHSGEKEKSKRRTTKKSAVGTLRNKNSDSVPLFQFALVQERTDGLNNGPMCIKYFAIRLLELTVQVDSGTLKLLFFDLLSHLSFVSSEESRAAAQPTEWVHKLNHALLSPEGKARKIDVFHAKVVATASKVYFETLIIHPMKLRLTFLHTPFSRDSGKHSLSITMLNVLSSLAEVDNMKIKLNSFIVSNALVSQASLYNRLVAKVTQDLQLQLASIAGSLNVIGSPLGLAHKIGGGVQAFFYEPYLGAVESPQNFLIGIGIGTSSLVSGVVSGALTSTVSIVDSASKGISYLSADPEYVRRRAMKKQLHQASKGGIVDGFVDGGENLVSGFASGVTGLFTKPFEEGAKGGVVGFMSGLGQGVVGLAVKPVLGVTDGFTSIAQGISNQVSNAVAVIRLRPARALERSDTDPHSLVVVPMDFVAAEAQDFIKAQARQEGLADEYMSYVVLDSDQSLLISQAFFYWRKTAFSVFKCAWTHISHIVYERDGDGIKFVLYKGVTHGSTFLIPITDPTVLRAVYTKLAKCSYLMGNPVSLLPLDVAERSAAEVEEYVHKYCKGLNMEGELDGYRFGSRNKNTGRAVVESETELLQNAQQRLASPFVDWATLDGQVSQMIAEWDGSHVGLAASHCCAALFINKSSTPLQLGLLQLKHGANMAMLGCVNYRANSRVILPQGSALLFAWGRSPTPMEAGEVSVTVTTDFFTLHIANDMNHTYADSYGSHRVSFLEKSTSQWWSKYVMHIS